MPARLQMSTIDRIRERCDVDPVGGCWIWRLRKLPKGYGLMRVGSMLDGSRRTMLVHRAAYEAVKGPIPAGHEVDHDPCNQPSCANPDHLVARLPAANNARSGSPTAVNARKTVCSHCGAALVSKPGRPSQRMCAADCYSRRYRERKRDATAGSRVLIRA